MKKVMVVVITYFVFVGLSFSTQTRINGLGLSNWMLEDDYNIWLNPAKISQYQKTIWFEPGTSPAPNPASQWAGASYKSLGGDAAIFISRPYTSVLGNLGQNAANSNVPAIPNFLTPNVTNSPNGMVDMTALTPQSKFDFLYSKKLNDKLFFGFMFNFCTNSSLAKNDYLSATPANNDGTAQVNKISYEPNLTFSLLRFSNNKKYKETDIVLNLTFPYVKNEYSSYYYLTSANNYAYDKRKLESNSNGLNGYGLTIRNMRVLSTVDKLYSYLQYNVTNLDNVYTENKDINADGVEETYIEQKRKQSTNNITLGMAVNTYFNDKCLFVVGSELGMMATINNTIQKNRINDITIGEYNYTSITYAIPIKAGFEYKLSKTFTPRIGIQKTLFQQNNTKINNPIWNNVLNANTVLNTRTYEITTNQQPVITVSAGVGMNLIGKLVIDATINYDIFYSGTYVISGVGNRPIAQMTMFYSF
jgi:hypothetical protein